MQAEDYAKLLSAIRMTAGALRHEADYVERKDEAEARLLRHRARAFDARAAEMAHGLTARPAAERG